MNHPKILDAIPLPDYLVLLTFDDDKIGLLDMKTKLEEEVYKPLIDKVLFEQVKTDLGGYGISWNDDIDMSEVECLSLCTLGSHLFTEIGSLKILIIGNDKRAFRDKIKELLVLASK
jgi:hypothetical protein